MDKEFYKKIKALISSNDDNNVFLGIELMKSLKGPLLLPFMQKLRRKDSYLMKCIDDGLGDGLQKLDIATLGISGPYHKYERKEAPLNQSISVLSHLIELSLTSLNITALPKDIGALKKLKTLYLSDNLIQELPKSIGDLKRLESLSISGNPLLRLPKTMAQLERLRYLNLSSTALECLPNELSHIRLRHLELSDCPKLKNLPKDLLNPWTIPTINLNDSGLESLPKQLSLPKGKERYLSLNLMNTKVRSLQAILDMDISEFKGAISISVYGTNIAEQELKSIRKKSTENCRLEVNHG